MTNHFHEVAGKTKAIAMALARRYGYGEPSFITFCGPLCILRFETKEIQL
jgi:hypothetical protein